MRPRWSCSARCRASTRTGVVAAINNKAAANTHGKVRRRTAWMHRFGTLTLSLWGGGIEESFARRIDSCACEKDCLRGRNFSFSPCRAVAEKLLLPDRHSALECIDAEAAGVERCGAMRGADGDEHRALRDFESPQPVNHRESPNREFFAHLIADFAHFGNGHCLIRLIFQVESSPIAGVVAHDAFKYNDRSVRRRFEPCDDLRRLNRLSDQRAQILFHRGACQNSAATNGRKKRDLVTGGKRGAPFGEFLVHRSHYGRTELRQLGKTTPIARKQILNAGAFGEFGILFRSANDVFQPAKEKHTHVHISILSARNGNFHHVDCVVAAQYPCGFATVRWKFVWRQLLTKTVFDKNAVNCRSISARPPDRGFS